MTLPAALRSAIAERHIARRDASAYKSARKLEWGDRMATPEEDG